MGLKNFEEITAWQRSRELTKKIYSLTNTEIFNRDWGLRDQLRRAMVSVTSNIAEGFDCGSNKEFVRFLNMSRRSLSEIQNQLYVALDQNYIQEMDFNYAYSESEEIRRMLTGFAKYLKNH
jgi:four helix bundle protein